MSRSRRLPEGGGRRVVAATAHNGRFASVYSGCGGLDLGFVQAGFELVWANDADADAIATHEAVFDFQSVPGRLEEVRWPRRGSVELVVGGPPCQGFSVAGRMQAKDERNQGVWRFFDFVEHVEPDAFVMENVKALAASTRWSIARSSLVQRARDLGFTACLLILNAADYGVPQRRERMFLIGTRGRNIESPKGISQWVSAGEALRKLPPFGASGNSTICAARITPAKRPVLRSSPYHGALLFNGSGRPLRLDVPAPTLPASMGGNNTPIVDQAELDGKAVPWVLSYHRRLCRGLPPITEVPRRLRRITVEEAAVLQGFPPEMPWAGSTSAQFRQIGNAVPPSLAASVARSIATAIGVAVVTSDGGPTSATRVARA